MIICTPFNGYTLRTHSLYTFFVITTNQKLVKFYTFLKELKVIASIDANLLFVKIKFYERWNSLVVDI